MDEANTRPSMPNLHPGEPVALTLPDHAVQRLRVWRGTGPCVILALHGLDGHAGWFGRLGPALAHRGYTLMAVDRAGAGVDARARGDSANLDVSLDELESLCERVAPRGGLFLLGHSWGAKQAVIALHERKLPVRAALLLAPLIHVRDDVSPLERWDAPRADDESQTRFKILFSGDALTSDPELRALLEQDAARLRYLTLNFVIEDARLSRRIDAMRGGLSIPLWLALGGDDHLVDEARTRAWFERVASDRRSACDVIEGASHLLPLDRADALADRIAWFLSAVT
jgi:alpha-beta hydrolase superfamily lysophospholipase